MYVYFIVVGCYCCLPLFSFPCGVPQGLVLSPTFFSSNYYYYFFVPFLFHISFQFEQEERRLNIFYNPEAYEVCNYILVYSFIFNILDFHVTSSKILFLLLQTPQANRIFLFVVLFYFSLHLIYLFYSGFVSVEKVCE